MHHTPPLEEEKTMMTTVWQRDDSDPKFHKSENDKGHL
jgi:hypothetical protein